MSDPVRPDTRSAPPPPAATPEAAGVVVRFDALRRALEGRYVLERELASGAMGVVLCARDLRHDRPVAVKVLRPELATATGADRFLREVRTAAGLLHPGIVTVYDSGEAGGLLYYVMPMVEGEALRERLERERSLPLSEAVRIARQVAEALAFAHARGIVHRDIKPENILLATHGHAQVTDFGVARALSEAEVRLTGTGAILGSPLYLSPEQAAGTRVDGRADVYSLGCVLYEMLVGVAPFEGSLAAVLTGHLTAAPPSACARRPDLPPAIDELIRRALVKLPEERLSARDMAEALAQLPPATLDGSSPILLAPSAVLGPSAGTLPETAPAGRSRRRARPLLLAGSTLVVIGLGSFIAMRASGLLRAFFPTAPPPDSTRYAVFPFRHDASVPASLGEADRVRDELARWQGLDVIDAGDAAAVLTRADSAGVDPGRALSLARQLRAGRFVTGRITREGDSLRIFAQVGDAGSAGGRRSSVRLAVPAALPDPGGTFRALADSLALAGVGAACVAGGTGTRSLPALRACDQASAALDDGSLAAADSLLRRALQADNRYARAALWLAQARGWLVERPPPSPELSAVVNAGRSALPPRERALADALALMNAGRYADACRQYGSLTAADSLDVDAWLGLGECHRRDNVVVRDPRSPSGWAFRSSYYQAVLAYKRAFEIQPQMMSAWKADGFGRLRAVFLAVTTQLRGGLGPGREAFAAFPAWEHDTLSLVPLPVRAIFTSAANATPRTLTIAADHGRELFHRLALDWVREYPRSGEALEALAIAQEALGDPAALATVGQARARAASAAQSARLARSEVWLRLKFGVPDHLDQVARGRSLADSLLSASPASAQDSVALVPLAVLLGRPDRAAALSAAGAATVGQALDLPTGAVSASQRLLAYAAVGQPVDSIRALAERVVASIGNTVAPQRQQTARDELLQRPLTLALPVVQLAGGAGGASEGYLSDAVRALGRHDLAGLRRSFARVDVARRMSRPSDLTPDALYLEAWLLHAAGDDAAAAARLDPLLAALQWTPPGTLDEPGIAGGLTRALQLRAILARSLGDARAARRWSAPLVVLWQSSEPALAPQLAEMVRLSRSAGRAQ